MMIKEETGKETSKEKYLRWTLLPFFGNWIFGIVLVSFDTIFTSIARKTLDPKIVLVPEFIYNWFKDYSESYNWIVIAWLLGETGIKALEMLAQIKKGFIQNNNKTKG